MNPLARYLQKNGISVKEFIESSGLPRITIWRIAEGKRGAGIEMAVAIERATGGAVKASSWANHKSAA